MFHWSLVFLLVPQVAVLSSPAVFNVYHYGAVGDGSSNDTAAIQRAVDAAAAVRGTAWLPANGTYMLGAGLKFRGHQYDGITLQVDGPFTLIDDKLWPHCPISHCPSGARKCGESCGALIEVINVDGFTLMSKAEGGLIGTNYSNKNTPVPHHAAPRRPNAMTVDNSTNILIENFFMTHQNGVAFFHNVQNVTIRNVTIKNRCSPVEEAGDLEIGGLGSHGAPWGAPHYYEQHLLSTNNVTIQGCYFSGGDDNIAIKNDTANVLVEDCTFGNGHGASIGSVPDANGLNGYVTNITFRNLVMEGNAACKIKTWPNTTGEISNILYENVRINGGAGSSILQLSTYYCKCTDPSKGWCHLYTPKPLTSCRQEEIVSSVFEAVGSCCAETENNIDLRNITFRNFTGTAETAGQMLCRKGRPCTIHLEDVNVTLTKDVNWACSATDVKVSGISNPTLPSTCVSTTIGEVDAYV